jgi:leader peptidase (prepilin peptidase)/N-methyltransferase
MELVPVFSWLAQGGKCKGCGEAISAQYPIIEAANAALWCICAFAVGFTPALPLYCLLFSALLTLSVIDARTQEIPFGINAFIAILGAAALALTFALPGKPWYEHALGLVAVSVPLQILVVASGGRAIGGGDVKLMAAAGLFLGWKGALLAFLIGCVAGTVVHTIRMAVSGAGRKLALGPYLAFGIALCALLGDWMIGSYMLLYK